MMSTWAISWTSGAGHGGNRKEPSWQEIEQRLLEVARLRGTVTMDVVGGQEIGPQSLQAQAENGRFVLFLGEDNGQDYVVRTFSNGVSSQEQVEILGNQWDSRLVCDRFDLVLQAFKEFFETGNVSRELLD
ncbi:MAG: DUF6911 family protein [Pseudomonadota bacterium]